MAYLVIRLCLTLFIEIFVMRISRNLLIQLLVVAAEMLAVVVASALTNGNGTMGIPDDKESLIPLIAAYAALIPAYTYETCLNGSEGCL